MKLPPRTKQLCGNRHDHESVFAYIRRAWEAEFADALSRINDVPTRNALLALKTLIETPK